MKVGFPLCAVLCHHFVIVQMPGLSEAGLKFMRDNCALRPRISVGWMGPFIGMVNLVHPDTVKVILKGSGINI